MQNNYYPTIKLPSTIGPYNGSTKPVVDNKPNLDPSIFYIDTNSYNNKTQQYQTTQSLEIKTEPIDISNNTYITIKNIPNKRFFLTTSIDTITNYECPKFLISSSSSSSSSASSSSSSASSSSSSASSSSSSASSSSSSIYSSSSSSSSQNKYCLYHFEATCSAGKWNINTDENEQIRLYKECLTDDEVADDIVFLNWHKNSKAINHGFYFSTALFLDGIPTLCNDENNCNIDNNSLNEYITLATSTLKNYPIPDECDKYVCLGPDDLNVSNAETKLPTKKCRRHSELIIRDSSGNIIEDFHDYLSDDYPEYNTLEQCEQNCEETYICIYNIKAECNDATTNSSWIITNSSGVPDINVVCSSGIPSSMQQWLQTYDDRGLEIAEYYFTDYKNCNINGNEIDECPIDRTNVFFIESIEEAQNKLSELPESIDCAWFCFGPEDFSNDKLMLGAASTSAKDYITEKKCRKRNEFFITIQVLGVPYEVDLLEYLLDPNPLLLINKAFYNLLDCTINCELSSSSSSSSSDSSSSSSSASSSSSSADSSSSSADSSSSSADSSSSSADSSSSSASSSSSSSSSSEDEYTEIQNIYNTVSLESNGLIFTCKTNLFSYSAPAGSITIPITDCGGVTTNYTSTVVPDNNYVTVLTNIEESGSGLVATFHNVGALSSQPASSIIIPTDQCDNINILQHINNNKDFLSLNTNFINVITDIVLNSDSLEFIRKQIELPNPFVDAPDVIIPVIGCSGLI